MTKATSWWWWTLMHVVLPPQSCFKLCCLTHNPPPKHSCGNQVWDRSRAPCAEQFWCPIWEHRRVYPGFPVLSVTRLGQSPLLPSCWPAWHSPQTFLPLDTVISEPNVPPQACLRGAAGSLKLTFCPQLELSRRSIRGTLNSDFILAPGHSCVASEKYLTFSDVVEHKIVILEQLERVNAWVDLSPAPSTLLCELSRAGLFLN